MLSETGGSWIGEICRTQIISVVIWPFVIKYPLSAIMALWPRVVGVVLLAFVFKILYDGNMLTHFEPIPLDCELITGVHGPEDLVVLKGAVSFPHFI